MSRGRKPFRQILSEDTKNIFWNNLPVYINIIHQFFKDNNYKFISIGEAMTKLSFPIPKGLNSNEIKKEGKFPVISQSQEYIVGFSDREDLLVHKDLPLVIFGDHSKTIKFVDKPFIIGADGIKIIKPKLEYNEKFFYFFLFGIITDTKSYGRHFSLIKNGLIPDCVDLKLQSKIVKFLEALLQSENPDKNIYFDKKIENKIVSIQNNYFKGIKLSITLSHQLTQIENLNQAILQEAVQGKLVKQDKKDEPASELLKRIKAEKAKSGKKEKPLAPIKPEEIPFKIPESWVWCRLGEIAVNVEYGTSQKAEMPPENIPVLRMNNIQSGKIDYSNLKYVSKEIKDLPRLFLVDKDLLFNRTNSYELVGKTGVYFGSNNSMTFASYLIRVQFDNNIVSEFVSSYINSPICRETQLEPEIIQQNGQANFNGTKLKNILIPLPPLSEQKRIVAEIEKQLTKTKQLKEHIIANQQATEQLLKALLHQAFEVEEVEGVE